ncbi:hypothetical protein J647_1288 [Acinetobacter baumannii 846928]|nr:hypothetical protein J647_1288 [Acinetobacter baumannii 846928]
MSSTYLYYLLCIIADTVYLLWFAYCMFSSRLIRNIVLFTIIYFAVTIIIIWGYFYLGEIYPSQLGISNTNSVKWSRYDLISIFSGVGVFMSPIAVLIGFNAWKKQQFEASKIKAIEEMKRVLSKQKQLTDRYRLEGNASLIKDRKWKEFDVNEKNWSDEFEGYRWEIVDILERNSFYFGRDEGVIERLYELNNTTLEIINNLEGASFQLKSCWVGSGRISPYAGEDYEEKDQFELLLKRIYLIEPNHLLVKHHPRLDQKLKDSCKSYENNSIEKPFNDFYKYLNQLLKTLYEN